jgi:glycosyltransferase involved in cell wall biosynthesis
MSISVCIIAKNEEGNIERCLQSAIGLADEIIFVDTGSTDKTVDIAKKFTDKIFHFEWNDNFSDAKNFALSNVTKEWILFLDADETIASSDYERVRELTKKTEFLGFSLIQRNYTDNIGEFGWVSSKDDSYEESKKAFGYIPRKMVRLFKNDSRIKFEGIVHENVGDSILKIGKILNTGIPIHHFGTLNQTPEKIRQYIELEKKNPKHDFFQYCKIGIQLHSTGQNDEAIEFLEKSIEKNQEFPFSFLELGVIMLEKRNLDEAKRLLHKAESLIEHPMIYNYLGVLYGLLEDYKKSIDYLKKAISLLPANADFHYNLGFAYAKAGMSNDAYIEMKKAAELNPAYKKLVEFY